MSKGGGRRTGREIAAGLPLLQVPPPYEEVLGIPEGAAVHPFSALVLRPRRDLDRASLATTIANLRRSYVMPVVVWHLPSGSAAVSFRRAEWIRKAGGEPLPAEEEPTGDRLRELLSVRSDLAGDWLGWLKLHRTLEVKAEATIRTIIEHSADHASVTGLLRDRSVPPRSARRWLAGCLRRGPGTARAACCARCSDSRWTRSCARGMWRASWVMSTLTCSRTARSPTSGPPPRVEGVGSGWSGASTNSSSGTDHDRERPQWPRALLAPATRVSRFFPVSGELDS